MPLAYSLIPRENEHAAPRERTKAEPQTNYTRVPNAFFSLWMQVLSGNEFKFASWVVRNTIGWIDDDPRGGRRRQTKPTSYGVVGRETGISRRKAMQVAHLLEAIGLIGIVARQGKTPSFVINISLLAQPGPSDELVRKIHKLRKGNVSQKGTSTCEEPLQVPVTKLHKSERAFKEESKVFQSKEERSTSSHASNSRRMVSDDEAVQGTKREITAHTALGEDTDPNGCELGRQIPSEHQGTSPICEASTRNSRYEFSTADEGSLSRIENLIGQALNGKAKQRILTGLKQTGYGVGHLELLLPSVFQSRRRIQNPIGLLISVAESFDEYARGLTWPEYLGDYAADALQQGRSPRDETPRSDCDSGRQITIAIISGSPEVQREVDNTCLNDSDRDLLEALGPGPLEHILRSCPERALGVAFIAEQDGLAGQAQLKQKKTEEPLEIQKRELEEEGVCPVCRGDKAQHPCFECSDTGQYYSARRLLDENLCNDCKGSGRWYNRNCFSCKGSGRPTRAMVKQYKAKTAGNTQDD